MQVNVAGYWSWGHSRLQSCWAMGWVIWWATVEPCLTLLYDLHIIPILFLLNFVSLANYVLIIYLTQIEDPEVLPEPIKELVGQSFCFGVSLENDNVTNGSDIFMVSQIWSGDKLLKAESHSVVSRESSMISGGEVNVLYIDFIIFICIYLLLLDMEFVCIFIILGF